MQVAFFFLLLDQYSTAYNAWDSDSYNVMTAGCSIDSIITTYGTNDHDIMQGCDLEDVMNGEANSDTLQGHLANDKLYGNSGDDNLEGGAGGDSLCWSRR